MTVAIVRPSEWEWPLFFHVGGSAVLVGALLAAGVLLHAAWRGDGGVAAARLGYRVLLLAAIPSYILMRGTAQWLLDKEGIPTDEPPQWVDIGFIVAEPSGLLVVIATVLSGVAGRRAIRGGTLPAGMIRAAAILAFVVVAASLVAIWAMTTKPV